MKNKSPFRLHRLSIGVAVVSALALSPTLGVQASQLTKLSQTKSKEQLIVKGKVVDQQNKEELIGASIAVKGLSTGAVTDANGDFTISVPYADATLVVSFVGYQPVEVKLGGRSTLTIELTEDAKALEEVVAVGHIKQRKETMTGAVATITTKDLAQSPTANLNNALAGRLPGLIANQYAGGEPGVAYKQIFYSRLYPLAKPPSLVSL